MTAAIKIRGHHLLCMQGFQGFGYNDRFTRHLARIIGQLSISPDTYIQAVAECDNICEYCPHQIISKCEKDGHSDARITSIDTIVLQTAGIEAASEIKYSLAIEQINSAFRKRSQLKDICHNCQWCKQCTWYSAFKE